MADKSIYPIIKPGVDALFGLVIFVAALIGAEYVDRYQPEQSQQVASEEQQKGDHHE